MALQYEINNVVHLKTVSVSRSRTSKRYVQCVKGLPCTTTLTYKVTYVLK